MGAKDVALLTNNPANGMIFSRRPRGDDIEGRYGPFRLRWCMERSG